MVGVWSAAFPIKHFAQMLPEWLAFSKKQNKTKQTTYYDRHTAR